MPLYWHRNYGLVNIFYASFYFSMSRSPLGRRTSISLYLENQQKLESLAAGLKRHGLTVDRTDIIRALVHGTSAPEIMGRGTLQDEFERSPAGKKLGGVVEFAPIRMPAGDFAKLEGAAERLAKAGIKASIGVLVRGLVMAAPPLETLAGLIKTAREDIPDGRALRWQAK